MLKLSNVSYRKSKRNDNLVNNVTLEVRESDYIVISGQNDAERRALLEIVGAVVAPTMGDVYIDGIELSKHTPNQLTMLRRGTFGYFLQDAKIDNALTVGENIQLPLVFAGFNNDEMNAKIDRVLNIVGLIGFKDINSQKLTEWQKNKLLIAVAIVKEPKVLILDEPCRVQDGTRLTEVLGLLSALNREGVTVIVASNNDAYYKVAKRRVEITNGAIIEIKKERAPREINKKTKTKKATKTKTVKEKKVEVKEISVQAEIQEEQKEKNPKKVAVAREVKTETSGQTVKFEEKPKKTSGRPKKVELSEEQPKKVGKSKNETAIKEVETKTRKKKGVETDANTLG